MSSTQVLLEEAIELYGMSDIVTIMLSQKRDKEVVAVQNGRFEEWLRKN